jgi:hypothetical protein
MVDHPPFPSEEIKDPNSPKLAESLIAFEKWFIKQQSLLQKQAATERPYLRSLASELSQDIE